MRDVFASQKIAYLELRIAKLEKQAMFSKIKKVLEPFIKWLRPKLQLFVWGASEETIKEQMRRLMRNKRFLKTLEKAPVRSGYQKLWNYMKIYLKKLGFITGSSFINTSYIILSVFIALGYFVGIPPLILGSSTAISLLAMIHSREYREVEYGNELAKQRLLNSF